MAYVVPPTAFGQPGGNTPSSHRFSSTHQPGDKRVPKKTAELMRENGARAVDIRNRMLRAVQTVLEDAEALAENEDAVASAQAVLGYLDGDLRGMLREAELSAGLAAPKQDEVPVSDATDLTIRQTAMAALELLRRAAAETRVEATAVDVTPDAD